MKIKLLILSLFAAVSGYAQVAFDTLEFGYDNTAAFYTYFSNAPASGASSGIRIFDAVSGTNKTYVNGVGVLIDGASSEVKLDLALFETVAFSGDYTDLLNKPTLGTASSQNSGAFATAAQGALADAAIQPGALASALAAKMNNPAGTTAQYMRGDGTLATMPTNLSGFTNGPGYVDAAGARSAVSLTTTGSGTATYNSSTGVLNVPTPAAPSTPSFANPSRTLNSAYQISSTRAALVSYSVDILCSATLIGGQTGTVFLEYADDSGFTTNVVEVGRFVNGN